MLPTVHRSCCAFVVSKALGRLGLDAVSLLQRGGESPSTPNTVCSIEACPCSTCTNLSRLAQMRIRRPRRIAAREAHCCHAVCTMRVPYHEANPEDALHAPCALFCASRANISCACVCVLYGMCILVVWSSRSSGRQGAGAVWYLQPVQPRP